MRFHRNPRRLAEKDSIVRNILFLTLLYSSPNHDREVFSVTYFDTSPSYAVVKNSVTKVELSCHPLDGLFDFEGKDLDRPQSAAKSDLGRDLAKMI